jgi:biopolymer transport protein ExbB/TolQ
VVLFEGEGLGMKKHLFLKWCLVTVITLGVVSMALILAKSQAVDLNPIAKTMVGVIALVYLIATIYCAMLCWQTDQALEDLEDSDTRAESYREQIKAFLRKIGHKADQVSFAANECPYIGLLGAITGIFFFMTSSLGTGFDPSHIKEVMSDSMAGIGIAFIPTITGVFFRIILSWEHYMVIHEVESALKGFGKASYRAASAEVNAETTQLKQNANGAVLWRKFTAFTNGPAEKGM